MAAILTTRSGKAYTGFNSRKTHPLAKKFGRNEKAICIHAEIDAIRRCVASGDDPRGGSLWVARVLKDGQRALAKPCEGCQRAILAFEINEVEWTE
jgi:deoxycytidylate deaminase